MPPRSAIVIVVDRLHVGMIGPYGNCWIRTPELNRLASESYLCDRAIIDSPQLTSIYRSYWQGMHAAAADPHAGRPGLGELLSAERVHTALLTDDRQVFDHPQAAGFVERLFIDSPNDAAGEDTELGQVFAAAQSWLHDVRKSSLLWIHARAMAGAWDASLELRTQYADVDDPPTPEFRVPPHRRFGRDDDPDELLGIVHAYAGQVSLLDSCIGPLLDIVRTQPKLRETLLVFTSARGFPLGEHAQIGAADDSLYSELVHVPLMLRLPDGAGALDRGDVLLQPADIYATLLDWWGVEQPTATGGRSILPLAQAHNLPWRQAALTVGQDRRALRTGGWHVIQSGTGPDTKIELYAKPDDRWEVNEVADRCPHIAAAAADLLASLDGSVDASNIASVDELLAGED